MIKALLMDLDGTVYRGTTVIPGASEFINNLKTRGIRIRFVTNRANRTVESIGHTLRDFGIEADADDIVTSSQATAAYLKPGTVFCIGEEGLREPLKNAGFTFTENAPQYVIVSLDRELTYAKLETACLLIRAGAQFVATNTDKVVNTDKGISPGTGTIVEAVRTATGVDPLVIGKPHQPILEMALAPLGLRKAEVVFIGDNPYTDISAGINGGLATVLILTGVMTKSEFPEGIQPDWVVADYDELSALEIFNSR